MEWYLKRGENVPQKVPQDYLTDSFKYRPDRRNDEDPVAPSVSESLTRQPFDRNNETSNWAELPTNPEFERGIMSDSVGQPNSFEFPFLLLESQQTYTSTTTLKNEKT
jgi:hypothetical protein